MSMNFFSDNDNFDKLVELTARLFASKPIKYDNVEFFEIHIETENRLMVSESSTPIKKNNLSNSGRFRKILPLICSVPSGPRRATFIWLSHSRTDTCCAANRGAQVPTETFGKKAIDEINTSISYTQISHAQFEHHAYL